MNRFLDVTFKVDFVQGNRWRSMLFLFALGIFKINSTTRNFLSKFGNRLLGCPRLKIGAKPNEFKGMSYRVQPMKFCYDFLCFFFFFLTNVIVYDSRFLHDIASVFTRHRKVLKCFRKMSILESVSYVFFYYFFFNFWFDGFNPCGACSQL